MSALVTLRTALPTIRRTVSHIPMGRTPGFLLSGISRQAMKAARPEGSVRMEQMRRVKADRALQRSLEAPWNAVHIRHHPAASMPDGPAEPCTLRAVERIRSPSILSKRTGCVSTVLSTRDRMAAEKAACAAGCFSLSMSRTGLPSISSSKPSTPAEPRSDTMRSAARTLPLIMRLAKVLAAL